MFVELSKDSKPTVLTLANVSLTIVIALSIHFFIFVFSPDTNVSVALTTLTGFNKSDFNKNHSMFLCSDFNMTFNWSLRTANDSLTQ